MARRKKKGKIKLSQKASVRKKGEGDSIKKAPTPMPRSNSAVFKVKVKKK